LADYRYTIITARGEDFEVPPIIARARYLTGA